MPLFCKNCHQELSFVTMMQFHVNSCFKAGKDTGDYAGKWVAATLSPKLMAETYFDNRVPVSTSSETLEDSHGMKAREIIEVALGNDGVRPIVKERLQKVLNNSKELGKFDHRNFTKRLEITGTVVAPTVYYRKMSQGEWSAASAQTNPFDATFKYMNKPLYRYWVSSSLAKVKAFGNENASDDGDVIVQITFKTAPVVFFIIKAHQEPGVQNNADLVAIHREGFAEIGSVSTEDDVNEIVQAKPNMLDHNLGFTSSQCVKLNAQKAGFKRLN
jgi:hypothetical protein